MHLPVRVALVRLIGAAAAIAVVAVGCSSEDGPTKAGSTTSTPDRTELVTAIGSETIAPAYRAAAETADQFATSVDYLCAAPTADAAAAARSALSEGWGAWQRTDTFDSGPAMERRSGSLVNYDVEAFGVDELLAGTAPSDVETIRNRLAAGRRGYGAADRLLVEDPARYESNRCGYLRAVAGVIATETAEVATLWEGGLASAELDPQDMVDEWVNMSVSDLQAIVQRLTAVIESGEAAPIELPPATLFRAAWTVDGIAAVLSGDGSSLARLLDDRLAGQLQTDLGTAEELLAPHAVAPSASPPTDADLEAVRDALETLRLTIGTEVVSALDVTVTFSDNDGDS